MSIIFIGNHSSKYTSARQTDKNLLQLIPRLQGIRYFQRCLCSFCKSVSSFKSIIHMRAAAGSNNISFYPLYGRWIESGFTSTDISQTYMSLLGLHKVKSSHILRPKMQSLIPFFHGPTIDLKIDISSSM
jgi:hypothetical protein